MLKGWRYTDHNPNALVLSPAPVPESSSQPYTVTDLVAAYLEFLQKNSQGSTYRDAASALRSRILPKFGHLALFQLLPEDLEKAHREDPHPVAANRAMSYLKAAWNRGERMRWCPPNSNPLRFLGDFTAPEAPRSRVLSDEELALVLAEIGRQRAAWLSGPASWAAVLLVLLTGARHREILTLKWKEVHPGALHLERSKTGAKVIFLSDEADALLQQLLLALAENPPEADDRVFAGVDLRRAWERMRKVCGCEDATLHDCRRSYASRLLASGKVELVDIARALGQKTLRVTAHTYAVSTAKRQRAIANIGAQVILGATTEAQEG